MTRKILLLMIIVTLCSCDKSQKNEMLKSSNWLLGRWENKSKDGNLFEFWKKANDSLFVGESYFVKGKDTLHAEKMELKQSGETLVYVSTIKGQNNDEPIIFDHNIEIAKQLVFENPNNLYPKKIVYQPFSKAHLLIEVSGTQLGKQNLTRYTLKKTN
jgi:hypothetical protein